MNKKKIVIIGGGNARVLINALKHREDLDVCAVIAMTDSGGSSGVLRQTSGTLPPGDILRALIAASSYDEQLLRSILYKKRFHAVGKLTDHNVGNIFLTQAAIYANGDMTLAIEALAQALNCCIPIYPVTTEISDLCVEVSNGTIVIGEHHIDKPKTQDAKILRAWLQPTPPLYHKAKEAIINADYIYIAPGSLYTSIIASLCVEGMQKEALRKSSAKVIAFCGNARETQGECGPISVAEYITTLEQYLFRPLDMIVYNSHIMTQQDYQNHKERGWEPLILNDHIMQDPRLVLYDYEDIETGGSSAKHIQTYVESCGI